MLHAANQDLACLAEVGLVPSALFDTELAGRLAGLPRVGLGPLVEQLLGLSLEKGHGAADWSRRPLPEDWLVYAALDVEVLVELRDVLAGLLAEQGKLEWAMQEFEAVRTAGPPRPRAEPWRRTSGLHKLRKPRALAAVRALWEARDRLAAERDIAPGRVLPDAAIVEAAVAAPESARDLAALPVFRGRSQRRLTAYWYAALAEAAGLDAAELPKIAPPAEGPPPVARWADREPEAAARLAAARTAIAALGEERSVPVENLLQPDLLRRLCWSPPADGDVAGALRTGGARPWQIDLLAPLLEPALQARG
ncbi:MAG: ribonuclease [Pseudonocardiales bacterium]|nr:ribonuclease [Pseudonocardiales bacterium]